MFADFATVNVGGVAVKVKRLTLAEIKRDRALLESGDATALDESRTRLIAEHCETADGKPIKPEDLSLPQMRKLMAEMVGLPDEGGLADFIGLLS